jgi:hypothetical protein
MCRSRKHMRKRDAATAEESDHGAVHSKTPHGEVNLRFASGVSYTALSI